ncbi:MAG: T9SS type A sorting domain-containing protein [Bacteroidia bacterium]|nr:T9SS type A sorting domain-containing protein [Bacteroidia bacterium]
MRYFILVLLCLLCQPLAAQQWERLPLNGGQFDKLVQNPYNEKDIIGYNRQGNFFRSKDGGNSWTRMRNETFRFDQSFVNFTFDPQGRIYATSLNGLWRSDADGVVWDSLPVPGSDHYFGVSQTKVTEDGSIFTWDSDTESLYTSTDDGNTWREVGPKDDDFHYDFYVDANDSKLILVLKEDSIVVTNNGGTEWIPYPIPGSVRSSIHSIRQGGVLVFRLSTGIDSLEVFESCDTGKTWQQWTRQTVRIVGGSCSTPFGNGKHFHVSNSVDIIQPCKSLLRSTDSGKTFQQLTSFLVLDAVLVDTVLIVTIPIRGVLRSTDYGDTWSEVAAPPVFFNFGSIEFAHAQDDTMFVLISDGGRLQSNYALLESNDGGMTWDSLFTSRAVYELFVDAGRPSRYYLHAQLPDGRYTLISGVAGQHVPDTLLITTSIPRPHPADVGTRTFRCIPSERFPGWIYVSKHTSTIGWSSNFGATWQWFGIPASVSAVTPWPSQLDPLRILIVAMEYDPMQDDYGGFFYTPDGGFSFSCISSNESNNNQTYNLYTTRTDRYFLSYTGDSCSTDYGCSWKRMPSGFSDHVQHIQNFQSHGEVILETDTGMYIFHNDRWRLLRDQEGNSIWTTEMHNLSRGWTIHVDKTDMYIYVLRPIFGLYRIKYASMTDRIEPGNIHQRNPRLRIYPNPSSNEIRIHYYDVGEQNPSSLIVFDVLGRIVWRSTIAQRTGVAYWSLATPDGARIPPGLYFVKLQSGVDAIIEKALVLY